MQSAAAVLISCLVVLLVYSSKTNKWRWTRRRRTQEIIAGPILNEQVIPDDQEQQQHELSLEEIQEKHIKQYLGGLYPKVDRQFRPLYLRDTLHPREIDPKWGEVVDGDIPFFW